MAHQTAAAERLDSIHDEEFHPRGIDDDPVLLEQSYRLRYQVYCVDRHYLNADDYPDRREIDEFDGHSVHVGTVDSCGELVGTARIIKPNPRGFPMFRYCAFFPEMRTLNQPSTVPVEVSRVSISRNDGWRSEGTPAHRSPTDHVGGVAVRSARRRSAERFLTLVKAIMQGAKRAGATHLIGATDAAFHRWLVHYGLPYRIAGPEVDYYGPVAPCIMSLHELDEVIVGGQYASLDGFPVGWDPNLWPGYGAYGVHPPPSVVGVPTVGWQPVHP